MIFQIFIFAASASFLYFDIAAQMEAADISPGSVNDAGPIFILPLLNFGTAIAMLSQLVCRDLRRSQKLIRTIGTLALGLCLTLFFAILMFAIAMAPG